MPPPPKPAQKKLPPRAPQPPPAPAPKPPPQPSHPVELGWLPDCVYTGEKFETGLAFFADSHGRISRFSRDPADLAIARRLAGQAALPGLVNSHSVSWQRVLRGRTENASRSGNEATGGWRDACDRVAASLTNDAVFEAARMSFTEMMLSGITCVGEFHELLPANGEPNANEVGASAREILRAAHEVGIRIALFNTAKMRSGHGQPLSAGAGQSSSAAADNFVRCTEGLRTGLFSGYTPDEAWLGVAPESLATVPLEAFKTIATYARAQRMRVQTRVAITADEAAACQREYGRTAVASLAEHGLLDKRLTVVHGTHLSEDDCRLLGTARASVCVCPTSEQNLGHATGPIEKLLAAGAGVALGTGTQTQIDLLKDARVLEYQGRVAAAKRPAFGPDPAKTLFHAATVAGARSLGATGGALEVGRPADFFTVSLYDVSIAGSDPESLLANIVFGLERRAIREVWVGARQRIIGGRHPNQGLIVGRFVDLQRKLFPAAL